MAMIALIVTAGETLTSLIAGSVGWAKLRPDRVLARKR
jgi:hypothetical protein